jgi:hypothetical protein
MVYTRFGRWFFRKNRRSNKFDIRKSRKRNGL